MPIFNLNDGSRSNSGGSIFMENKMIGVLILHSLFFNFTKIMATCASYVHRSPQCAVSLCKRLILSTVQPVLYTCWQSFPEAIGEI